MKVGIVTFPGSNCDHDVYHVVKHALGADAAYVWHKDRLPEGLDLHDTADRRGKSVEESTARLARMVGCDLADASMADWRDLAQSFAERQLEQLVDAARRVIARGDLGPDAPLVGAGAGRFVLRDLAKAA